MNIYLIKQNKNNGYDTYDSAVVIAETEEQARLIHPRGTSIEEEVISNYYDWCEHKFVTVTLVGKSDSKTSGVLLASYNAG